MSTVMFAKAVRRHVDCPDEQVPGATLREALEMAMAAASVVIHQLGPTGTADLKQIRALLFPDSGGR